MINLCFRDIIFLDRFGPFGFFFNLPHKCLIFLIIEYSNFIFIFVWWGKSIMRDRVRPCFFIIINRIIIIEINFLYVVDFSFFLFVSGLVSFILWLASFGFFFMVLLSNGYHFLDAIESCFIISLIFSD